MIPDKLGAKSELSTDTGGSSGGSNSNTLSPANTSSELGGESTFNLQSVPSDASAGCPDQQSSSANPSSGQCTVTPLTKPSGNLPKGQTSTSNSTGANSTQTSAEIVINASIQLSLEVQKTIREYGDVYSYLMAKGLYTDAFAAGAAHAQYCSFSNRKISPADTQRLLNDYERRACPGRAQSALNNIVFADMVAKTSPKPDELASLIKAICPEGSASPSKA